MMEFTKARLVEVADRPDAQPRDVGSPIEVQINPATLRLQMASTVDFGKDASRQKIQYQGSTSTLSFDLVFDTADEGTTDVPVDVRTRTRQLERFVLPAMTPAKAVPPRVRFTYGSLSVIGAMTVLNQDFDFFARNGVPLRAKCAVTIKVQRPEFDASRAGPGANTGAGAIPPVPPDAAGPGAGTALPLATPPPSPPDRTGTAIAGESAPDFAGRMGLDPRAWKALQGITDPLRLPPGLAIDFSSSATPVAGLGVEVGATALAGAGPATTGRAAVAPADGAALATAGGLTRVLDRAAAASAGAAAAATRAAFAPDQGSGVPAAPATVVAGAPAGGREEPPVDPRAIGFGFGVPLRPRIGVGHTVTAALVRVRGRAAATGDRPPETDDRTVPGWEALPLARRGTGSDAARSGGRCGCGGAA